MFWPKTQKPLIRRGDRSVLQPKATARRKLPPHLLPPGAEPTTPLTSASTSLPKNMSDEMALAPANFWRASLDSRPELRLSTSLLFVTLWGGCGVPLILPSTIGAQSY